MSVTTTTPSPASTASAASQISVVRAARSSSGPIENGDHGGLGTHDMFRRALQFGREPPMGDDDDPDHLCRGLSIP
jgi:hypothetical protein